jgi:hypothetical protein
MNVLHSEYIRWSQEKGGACRGLLMFLHVVSVVTLSSLSNDAGLVIWIYKHQSTYQRTSGCWSRAALIVFTP